MCERKLRKFLLLALATIVSAVCASAVYAAPIAPESESGFTAKKAVIGTSYMAVTAHPSASKVASDMLAQGANAVDAAIAAQMVLNLVEPQSSGIGGGGFMLYYDAETKKTHAYDGREIAPEHFDISHFYGINKTAQTGGVASNAVTPNPIEPAPLLPFSKRASNASSVGVAGLLAMLNQAHDVHGEAEWRTLFEPAITLARNGYTLSPRLHKLLEYGVDFHGEAPFEQHYLLPDNSIPPVGHRLTNRALAESFAHIATEGADAFYKGELAYEVSNAVKAAGGSLTRSDMADYEAIARDVLCMPYRSFTLCSAPPPAGGMVVLQAMGILAQFDMQAIAAGGDAVQNAANVAHVIAEATRLAFADRDVYLGDPRTMQLSADMLLDPHYLKKRAALIDLSRAREQVKAGAPSFMASLQPVFSPLASLEQPSTTHMSIVDKAGNIVSMTSSIEHAFGSGINVAGFFLNNQLTDFSFPPVFVAPENDAIDIDILRSSNFPAIGKRPRSSMSPMLVFDAQNTPILAIGSPGGARIIPYIIQSLVNVLDFNIALQESIEQPHILAMGDGLELEAGRVSPALANALQTKGHTINYRPQTSGIHAIALNDGTLTGAADPRREGLAVGK